MQGESLEENGIAILLEPETIVNIIYGLTNAVIILLTGIIVYRKDPASIVNRGFSLSSIFAFIGFTSGSLGALLWTTPILVEPGVVTLNRLSYFSVVLTATLVCWSSRVLYDGQAFWNRTLNLIFFGSIISVNFFAVMTPDASYIIPDIPEKHTAHGTLFIMISYPSIAILAVTTFLTFLMTYRIAKDDDTIIGRQAGRLAAGSLLIIIGMALGFFVGAQLAEDIARYISYTSITLGILMMASGFTQESSLIRVKILSELKRLSRSLTRGNTNSTEEQIKYLSALVEKEGAGSSITKLRVLDGLLAISKLSMTNARITLESARALAEQQDLEQQMIEIDGYLRHLEIHESQGHISSSGELLRGEDYSEDDVLRALTYLDDMIRQRMKEEEDLRIAAAVES